MVRTESDPSYLSSGWLKDTFQFNKEKKKDKIPKRECFDKICLK